MMDHILSYWPRVFRRDFPEGILRYHESAAKHLIKFHESTREHILRIDPENQNLQILLRQIENYRKEVSQVVIHVIVEIIDRQMHINRGFKSHVRSAMIPAYNERLRENGMWKISLKPPCANCV